MVSFKRILTHVLQGHGFETYERDDILFGEREGSVICVGVNDTCDASAIATFLDKVKNVECPRVIACASPVEKEMEDMAASNGITIWHLEDIEREIGTAIINHMGSGPENTTVPFFSEIVLARAPKTASVPAPGRPTTGASAPETAPDDKTIPVVIDSLGVGESERYQTPKISLEDVKEISRKTVKGFKFDLEVVPHYLFEYYCRFEGKGGAERKATGLILINAFTGFPMTMDEEMVLSDRIDVPHVKIEPKIDEEEALAAAMAKVIELNTEHDDLIVEKEHATVTERTIFKPSEDNITLTKKGAIHVPVWCVEGTHGVMIINAASGKALSEEYYDEKDGY